jgi:tRNA nucleotidyltransferase (CCA-adding enzyme)
VDDNRPPFAVEPEAIAVLETLWEAGHGAYLVGGGVRDALLGVHISDWDVATDARPERILRIFPGSSYQNRFGTVLARGLEVTTFRKDHRYADHRRPDSITFSEDVYEDLARRDLTINAMAWGRRGPDVAARLLDPADGQGDLRARLVRAVGDPTRRFDEDALRLLRAVRIAARLDFIIEPLTERAMAAHAADIGFVSEERIGSEIRRMLAAPTPSRAFRLMRSTGILATALPELEEYAQESERPGTNTTTGLDHLLVGLDAATAAEPENERVALAALLGPLGPERARRVLDRLRVAGRSSDAICELITATPETYQHTWSSADVRRYMGRVHDELLDDLLVLRRARVVDDVSAGDLEEELAQRVAAERASDSPLTLADLAIDGRDLRETLGVPESPAIGIILERLMADVIEEPSLNVRTTLLTRASFVLDELVQRGHGGADRPAIG